MFYNRNYPGMGSRNYLSTLEAIGETPMVDLPSLSPKEGASISMKWEGANPTGSLKDRMALAIVKAARERGDIEPGDPVVEFTGGSTGTSLAFVCAVLGHPFHVVTADCVADEKVASMRALGHRSSSSKHPMEPHTMDCSTTSVKKH